MKTDEGMEVFFQVLLISALHDSEWVALPPRPGTHLIPRTAGKRKIPAPTVNWNPIVLSYIPNLTDKFSHVDGNIILPIPLMISDHMVKGCFLPSKNCLSELLCCHKSYNGVSIQDWLHSTNGLTVKIMHQSHRGGIYRDLLGIPALHFVWSRLKSFSHASQVTLFRATRTSTVNMVWNRRNYIVFL
jgi:hypothetical protein